MLWTIIAKEFLEKVLTLRFFVALILSIALTIVSVVVLSEDYAQELADYHLRTQMRSETNNEQLVTVDRKPSILTALFQGVTKGSARSVQLLIGFQPKIIETIDDNPFSVLFPTVDLTFIIGIVMSLLALLFAYDAVCGELEKGTLALIASHPIKKPMLILGKWLGGYFSLILPCSVGWLLGLLILSMHPHIQLTVTEWSALGLIIIGTLLYLACFFALGVLISTLTTRSSTAIVVLLFLWTLFVFVIPNLSPNLAKTISPIPSFSTHSHQMTLAQTEIEHQRQSWHDAAALEVIDKRLTWTDGKKLLLNIEARSTSAQDKTLSNITQAYHHKIQKQEQIAAGIAVLSPYACFTFFATQLAASHFKNEAKFIAATERFENEYFADTPSYFQTIVSPGQGTEKSTFFYTESTVPERLKLALGSLSLLMLYTGLCLVGGYAAFMRYDVKR